MRRRYIGGNEVSYMPQSVGVKEDGEYRRTLHTCVDGAPDLAARLTGTNKKSMGRRAGFVVEQWVKSECTSQISQKDVQYEHCPFWMQDESTSMANNPRSRQSRWHGLVMRMMPKEYRVASTSYVLPWPVPLVTANMSPAPVSQLEAVPVPSWARSSER